MSLEDTDFGYGKGVVPTNPIKYVKLMELISKLKKEINFLKAHLGKDETEWIIKRDSATRTNRIPNEPNEFGFPLDFDEEKVHHLRTSKLNQNWCYFKYYYNNDFPTGKFWEYDMPRSLYKFLEEKQKKSIDIKTKKEIKKISKKGTTNKFKSSELLLQYFREKLGKKYYNYSRLSTIINFLFEKNKEQFGLEDISIYCEKKHNKKPVPATIHKHLNLLIEHNIISRKHHGIYEVNEHSINVD